MYSEGTEQYEWLDERVMMLELPKEWIWLERASTFHLETLWIFLRPGVKRDWRLAVPLFTQMAGSALSVPCPSTLSQADSHVKVLEHPIPPHDFNWFPLRRSRCYPSRSLGVCCRGLALAVNQERVVENTDCGQISDWYFLSSEKLHSLLESLISGSSSEDLSHVNKTYPGTPSWIRSPNLPDGDTAGGRWTG